MTIDHSNSLAATGCRGIGPGIAAVLVVAGVAAAQAGAPVRTPAGEPVRAAAAAISFPGPPGEVPGGMTIAAGGVGVTNGVELPGTLPRQCLVAVQGNELWVRAAGRGAWRPMPEAELPDACQDLALWKRDALSPVLVALPAAWTTGAAIPLLRSSDGKQVGAIPGVDAGRKDAAASGVEVVDGTLWVLERQGALHRVDVQTGAIEQTLQTGLRGAFGLTFDGARFWCGSPDGLRAIDPASGKVVRTLQVGGPIHALVFAGCWGPNHEEKDLGLLFLEQPPSGGAAEPRTATEAPLAEVHRVVVQPDRLEVRVERTRTELRTSRGKSIETRGAIAYVVDGATRCETDDQLDAALKPFAACDPRPTIRLVPGPKLTYGNVVTALDALERRGWNRIEFGETGLAK